MKRYCIIVGNAASDAEFIKIERMCYINAANRGYVLFKVLHSRVLKERIILNLN
jgi:hypothetical protein